VPDSSVTGPAANRAAPNANDTPATIADAVSANTTTTYLMDSSLARPAGTASR
jgi:hypothetical protein